MNVRDQLMFLLQLQTADVKVKELQTAANQLPAKLDPLRRDLAKLQGMLDAERTKLGETEAWRKQQQDLIDRERDALKIAQSKLQASKNSKEFGAASREVENKRKSITDREAELKKVVEASQSSAAQLTSRDKDVDGVRTELTTNEDAMSEQLASLHSQLAEAKATRDSARAHVEAAWLKQYDSLVGKRGYAVAPVVKGVCQGCHMALPPQLNNILARLESIETCPRCARLVYRRELFEPKVEEPPKPEKPVAEKKKRERKPAKPKVPKPVAAKPVAEVPDEVVAEGSAPVDIPSEASAPVDIPTEASEPVDITSEASLPAGIPDDASGPVAYEPVVEPPSEPASSAASADEPVADEPVADDHEPAAIPPSAVDEPGASPESDEHPRTTES